MNKWLSCGGKGEGCLWLTAFVLSLLINLGLLLVLGLGLLQSHLLGQRNEALRPVMAEPVLTIVPEIAASVVVPEAKNAPAKPRFARTSDEQQTSEPAKNAPFIGERSTRAASDRAPTPSAPAQPSQKGITPRDANDIETTQSKYQDGELTEPSKARESQEASKSAAKPSASESAKKSSSPPAKSAPQRSGLVQGPNPVDVGVSTEELKKPIVPDARLREDARPQEALAEAPKPKPFAEGKPKEISPRPPQPKKEKEFRGNQRKTAMVGSISRSGPSSLDVADTPLGRYQATISRAVEIEWQRNCVRHRDFITPGFLTVRFFVETSGKVRSVQFVGDMETGEVQKGFTLNAIRNADIPPMPKALRKEYNDEPLELMFRFYF
ncbi:MAG: hypothetical protein KGQ87_04450 [Verrucomicrobia bacterium]|nr:hypothetical protein [Verrucomicrobiota bacterium]